MSVAELHIAIRRFLNRSGPPPDDNLEARMTTLSRPLESVWPVIEELAENLSILAHLPLAIYLGDYKIYSFPSSRFSQSLKSNDAEPIVAQRQVPVVGSANIVILFGADINGHEVCIADHRSCMQSERVDHRLLDSIQQTFRTLIEATVNFHVRAVNMTHEVTMVLQGTSSLLADVVEEIGALGRAGLISNKFKQNADIVEAEYECALYVLQNFLSDAGYSQYREAQSRQTEEFVNPCAVFDRLIQIYYRTERGRRLQFVNDLPQSCPRILGHRLELVRAFHNVMSNAVKYSYVPGTESGDRRVRIYAKIPYGTASRKEWAICVENYGVGLRKEEQYIAFRSGFRGRDAVEQTGLGAGIGLSEVQKIMHSHGGRAKIRSRFLHSGRTGDIYLTTVSLIFVAR